MIEQHLYLDPDEHQTLVFFRSLLVHLENGYIGRGFHQFCPQLQNYNVYVDNIYDATKVLRVRNQPTLNMRVLWMHKNITEDKMYFGIFLCLVSDPTEEKQGLQTFQETTGSATRVRRPQAGGFTTAACSTYRSVSWVFFLCQ